MNTCAQCNAQTTNSRFCNKSCSAKYNNRGVRRHGNDPASAPKCKMCDNKVTAHRAKFCSLDCSGKFVTKQAQERNYANFLAGKKIGRDKIYEFLKERDGNKCSQCGIVDWRGNPLRFWVDHIDGNASNHSPDNFRLVCLNCDSQSPTFGARNTGKGRKSLGMKQYD